MHLGSVALGSATPASARTRWSPRPQAAGPGQAANWVGVAATLLALGPCGTGTLAVASRLQGRQRGVAGSCWKVVGHGQEGPGAGGNFGGLTAALSVKHELQGDLDVTVISASDRFLFNPSLIWLPFGTRRPADITFPLAPTFQAHQVDFVHAAATRIDPAARQVETTKGRYGYDYLVIATGYRNQTDVIPGLDIANSAYTITTLEDAIHAGEGWRQFLDDPGPVVIGATQGAGCFGAASEFLFNLSYQLKKAGLRKRVPLTYVTAEPFLGHFGIGGLPGGEKLLGLFLRKEGIQAVTNTAMTEVAPGKLLLADGRVLDFAYAMIVPPFLGHGRARRGAQDRLPHRGPGPCGRQHHRCPGPRPGAGRAQGVRGGPGGVCDGCRQQRGADLGRQDAAAPQGWGDDSRPPVPCGQAAVRAVFLWKARHGYVRLP
jgi:Pyridine nucleotide-disulphide oxidoreductase